MNTISSYTATEAASDIETVINGIPVLYGYEEWDRGDGSYFLVAVQMGDQWMDADSCLSPKFLELLGVKLQRAARRAAQDDDDEGAIEAAQ